MSETGRFRYVYIQVRETDSGLPSFNHVMVDALDDEDAYCLGYDAVNAEGAFDKHPLNDYAVRVQ